MDFLVLMEGKQEEMESRENWEWDNNQFVHREVKQLSTHYNAYLENYPPDLNQI